jgi:pullulanase/glycogen debranching enzyme
MVAMGAEPIQDAKTRALPGVEFPSAWMNYRDATATGVTVAGAWADWTNPVPLTVRNGIWSLDVRPLQLPFGRHEYKFIVDGKWEKGDNRHFFINEEGLFESPSDLIVTASLDDTNYIEVIFAEDVDPKRKPRIKLVPEVPIADWRLSTPDEDATMQGYKLGRGGITFVFSEKVYGQKLKKGDRVMVAGNFNGWRADGDMGRWELKRLPRRRIWVLTRPLSALRKPAGDDAVQFKFVINQDRWMAPPDKALNAHDDGKGNSNLEIDPKLTGSARLHIRTAEPLSLSNAYMLVVEGLGRQRAIRQVAPGEIMNRYVSDKPLGVEMDQEQQATTYRLFAPRASSVHLCLFDQPEYEYHKPKHRRVKPVERYPMWKDDADGVWEISVLGVDTGRYYSFNVDGPSGAGEGFYPDAQVGDPYARAAAHAENNPIVIDIDETNRWFGGWTDQDYTPPRPEEMIIYEAHMRDLTIHPSAKVNPSVAGKYAGLSASRGTGTGLDHLHDLGVNMIEFLPLAEFNNGTNDEHNWGYTTTYYYAPESSYARDAYNGSQVYEFKNLVNELHREGFGVIMDVVYNHVGYPNLFAMIDRKYFFRLNPDWTYSDFSGCGNDVRTEAPMMRQFIVDNILFWIEEYHIDGFRFDLAELIDMDTMLAIRDAVREKHPEVILISEPWSFRGENKHELKGTGWSAWNNDFRYAAKDFAMGQRNREWLQRVITGSVENWTANPLQAVNYLESHDDMALADELCTRPDRDGSRLEPMWADVNRLAATILFTSLGIPMIAEGQEFLRSKRGIHNSYDQGDVINALDWTDRNRPLAAGALAYYKDLIAMRNSKQGAAFRVSSRPEKDYYRWLMPPNDQALGYIVNAKHRHAGNAFVVLLNASGQPVSFSVPFAAGAWRQIGNGERINLEGIPGGDTIRAPSRRVVRVPPISSVIYMDGF